MKPAVKSTGSQRTSRQVWGSPSMVKVRVHGLVPRGIGRYTARIRTPHHSAASLRRTSASARTPVSTRGVVSSPMPSGMKARDTRVSTRNAMPKGIVIRASISPCTAASRDRRALSRMLSLFIR